MPFLTRIKLTTIFRTENKDECGLVNTKVVLPIKSYLAPHLSAFSKTSIIQAEMSNTKWLSRRKEKYCHRIESSNDLFLQL